MDFNKIVDNAEEERNEAFKQMVIDKIHNFLKEYVYGYYRIKENIFINDDMEINVNGSVSFKEYQEDEFPPYIRFNNVTGVFAIKGFQNFKSLKGFPKTAGAVEITDCPKLKSIEGLPSAPNYLLGHIGIRNLDGFPESKRYKGLNKKDKATIGDLFGFGDLMEYPSIKLVLNNNLESLHGLPSNICNLTILRCKKIRSIDDIKSNVLTLTSDMYAIKDKCPTWSPKDPIKNFEFIDPHYA